MYSQNKEEEAILKYFDGLNRGITPPSWVIEGRPPCFLSIGENDGETLSNVRALALAGWCGCMVEPSPEPFRKLKALYETEKKGCFYLYNVAVGNTNGKAILHDSGSLLKTGDTGLVSTLVAEQKKRFESVLSYTDVEVKVYRWKTLLNRFMIKKFDFINIDCEGLDGDILEQIDVTDVRCVCIEWNGKLELKERFSKYLHEFKIIYTSGENLIFAR